tara:strand:- start:693 stop:1361 length:669 start_codon:yes stop_codon:yes gene_type:complete
MTRISIALTSILLLVTLTTFNPTLFKMGNNIFKIKYVEIENINIINKKELKKIINNELKNLSLFSINEKKMLSILKKYEIIKSIEIKKVFPNKIKIKLVEKEIIATLINKKKKFYLTLNGEKIIFFKNEKLDNLPKIFGAQKNFTQIYNILKKLNFPINEIKSFYYFDIGRWDIVLKNSNIIKLPVKNFNESLINYNELKNDQNFKKYKIFDYRIKDQLILN